MLATKVSPSRGTGTARAGVSACPVHSQAEGEEQECGNSLWGGCPSAGGAEPPFLSRSDCAPWLHHGGCSARRSHPDNSPCPLALPFIFTGKRSYFLPSSPQEGAEGSAVLGPSVPSSAGAQIKQRSPSVSPDGLSVPGALVIQPFPHLQEELELSSVSKK